MEFKNVVLPAVIALNVGAVIFFLVVAEANPIAVLNLVVTVGASYVWGNVRR